MAMDKSSADCYVYAKASGMLASSYVGRRAQKLFDVRSLHELWSLISDKEVPAVPETLLAKMLEIEARDSFISSYKKLISNYSKPSPILISLLHFYDYDNLKEMGAALCFNEKEMPDIVDTSPFSLIDYSAWPDIKKITQDSVVSWYDHVPLLAEQQSNDYRLDVMYLRELWQNVQSVNPSCKETLTKLFLDKINIENVLWALRLRVYYNMRSDEILGHLAYSSDLKQTNDIFVRDAIKIIDWDLHSYDQWQLWTYSKLLNPYEEGEMWCVDPRWISNSYKKQYVARALKTFHMHPFSECPLVCWFVVKRNELDAIRTVSEGLRMNVNMNRAMQMAGVMETANG